jgi:hypothetical protein
MRLTYIADPIDVVTRRGATVNILARRADTRFSYDELHVMVTEWVGDDRQRTPWLGAS